MKFTFLTIGKIKEKWMRQGIDEYLKRLSPIAKVEILSPDEEKMPENPSAAVKGKDVGHKKAIGKGGKSVLANLFVQNPGANRSFSRNKDGSMKSEKSKRER